MHSSLIKSYSKLLQFHVKLNLEVKYNFAELIKSKRVNFGKVCPDLAKFHQFGFFKKYLTIVYLAFTKILNLLWQKLYAFGQMFNVVNSQLLKKHFGNLVTLYLD